MTKLIFRGLGALLPVTVTLYFTYWALLTIETSISKLIKLLFGNQLTFPGIGLLSTFLLILTTGVLMSFFPFKKLVATLQVPFKNIPLIKSIYSAIEDLLSFFDKEKSNSGKGKVVKVYFPDKKIFMMGLLTCEAPEKINGLSDVSGHVGVYIPVSYQIGGYTIFVEKENVFNVDMKVEELMKSSITAWMKNSSI